MIDFVIRNAAIDGVEGLRDVAVRGDAIAAIAPLIEVDAPDIDAGGRFLCAGLVETHIHLDKSCICDRCAGANSLADSIRQVAALKPAFTEEDVYERGRRTLEKAISHGTMRMRTHVEIDPRIGLRGFNAVKRLKRDYAWAIDVRICAFPQEGLTNDPGAEELLIEACRQGADLIGGCPYADSDPQAQIARIFSIAREFDVDVDFHLDFDLDPSWMSLDDVIRATGDAGWGGRVAVGHATKLSAIDHAALDRIARRLASAGVAVTVLPATDLFLMGRGIEANTPRGVAPAHRLTAQGVATSIATNNVLNPFTPYGDCSLVRMANLYANIAQLGSPAQLAACFRMISSDAARLMGANDYGLREGGPADLLLLDAAGGADAVAAIAPVLRGWKRGRLSFDRPAAALRPPALEG